jgi:hypothetical protein
MRQRAINSIRNVLQKLKKPILWLFSGLLILFALAWAMARIYEDEVKAYFLSKLNENLNTKVEIASIDLSLIQDFPNASIILNDVKVHHSSPFTGPGHFLVASRMRFRFSLFAFFSGNYNVKRIDLENGMLQVLTSSKNISNYNIFKTSKDSSESHFKFEIDMFDVDKLDVLIDLKPSSFTSKFLITDAQVSGAFDENAFELGISSDLQFDHLNVSDTRWISDLPVDIDCKLIVDKEKQEYTFSKGKIKLSEMNVNVSGLMKFSGETPYLDLNLGGENLDISSVLSLLPESYKKEIADYDSDGDFYGDANIKGSWSGNVNPHVEAHFGIKGGTIEQKKNDIKMENVILKGTFTNGSRNSMQTSILNLSEAQFNIEGGKAEGVLKLSNLEDLTIHADFNAGLDLEEVFKFFPTGKVQDVQGRGNLDVVIDGKIGELLDSKGAVSNSISANGHLTLVGASFKIEGDTMSYRNLDASFRFSKHDVLIERFKGNAGSSDFSLNGSLINLFGYILSDDQPIGIRAQVQSRKIVLDELFGTGNSNESPDSTYKFRISPRLTMKMNARVEDLRFRKFRATGIIGDLTVRNRVLNADRLSLRTMGGKMELEGSADGSDENKILVVCQSKMANVDISQLFLQCENFGQEVITDKHIRGILTASIDLGFPISSTLVIDTKKLKAVSDITISEGRLMEFEPLNNLSRFVSLDELKDVKFSELKNKIEISNRAIIIPKMEITSSALSIFASGTHTFDNVVDYHFQLTLSDILSKKAKKAKRENEEFGIVEEDGSNRTQLFLSMSGPIANPKISYDSKGAKEKFKQDIKTEKQTVKQLLREEFGLFKKDTTLKKSNVNDQKKRKVIIEFDE